MAIELFELDLPQEISAAFERGKRCTFGIETVCPHCGKGPRDWKLRAGILTSGPRAGKPWWGCMRCHCETRYAAERHTAKLKIGFDAEKAKADAKRLRLSAMRTWECTSTIRSGDPVDRYLREQRMLTPVAGAWPVDIRYAQIEYHHGDGRRPRRYDAMVAAVRTPAGDFMGIHRTYLMPDGQRADGKDLPDDVRVHEAKKAMGPILSGSVHLYSDCEPTKLGIAEGIETSVAFQMYLDLPCVSTISAAGMEAVQIPKSVRYAFIGPDIGDVGRGEHDKHKGLKAAVLLRERLLADAETAGRPLTVTLCPPPISGRADWNDWAIAARK